MDRQQKYLRDGKTEQLSPVSTERLEEFKQGVKLVEDVFGPIADAVQKGNDKEAQRLIHEAIGERKRGVPPE